ncbi:protein MKS1 [Andrographis paniculata]|uniref:protein MKS1 n=1 Tax=Andrographis paniculata TaxID=175694 RepID=UPI0021E72E95|nr:protein MKS1 [Andrographis paniculata]
MDLPEFSSGRSPRRELQGPRPTPLKVRKDSHKIRKPPVAPPTAGHLQPPPHAPPRPPVIIYTVSPKIIHANPNEFMSLVQRLTGPNSASSSTSSSAASAAAFHDAGGSVSPAARFASIEKTRSPGGRNKPLLPDPQNLGFPEGIEFAGDVHRTGQFPGILSPNPNSLPPIPPKFFSPPSENINPLSYFPDLSPVQNSSRINFTDTANFLLPSPSPTAFISPLPNINMPSPNTIDLFHSLFDL